MFFGNTNYGPEVDAYSFGIILWELLTRRTPWDELQATEPLELFAALDAALRNGERPKIPPDLESRHGIFVATMKKCWADDVSVRPSFEKILFTLNLVTDGLTAFADGLNSELRNATRSNHCREPTVYEDC